MSDPKRLGRPPDRPTAIGRRRVHGAEHGPGAARHVDHAEAAVQQVALDTAGVHFQRAVRR